MSQHQYVDSENELHNRHLVKCQRKYLCIKEEEREGKAAAIPGLQTHCEIDWIQEIVYV